MIGSEDERVNQDVGTPREGPRTEAGRALAEYMKQLAAAGEPNRATDASLDRSVVAIEAEARSAALDEVEAAVGAKRRPEVGMIRAQLIAIDGWNDCRDAVLRAIASLRDKETAK